MVQAPSNSSANISRLVSVKGSPAAVVVKAADAVKIRSVLSCIIGTLVRNVCRCAVLSLC